MTHTNTNSLTLREKMKLILDTGQLMLENGSSTKRVIRDMLRTAAYLGIYWQDVLIHTTYSTIMINVTDGEHSYTMFRKCFRHGVNMETVLKTSRMSWSALANRIPLETFSGSMDYLVRHSDERLYPEWLVILAIGLASSAFCTIFGGNFYDGLYTMLAAMIGAIVKFGCAKLEMNGYIVIAASAFASTLAAFYSTYLPGHHSAFLPMAACALTLVPGVPLINAVDDFLNNYLIYGMCRITHTLLILLAMTMGIAGAVAMTDVPSFTEVQVAPESLYLAQAMAAALGSACFSILFNVPKRYIFLACLGAIITVDARNFLMVEYQMSMAGASFFGAALLSLVYFSMSRYLHAPIFILNIPAIIPLIPGVLLYRFLFGLINIHNMDLLSLLMALQSGMEAVLTLIGISVGALLPDVIGHQYIDRKRRKSLQKVLGGRGIDASLKDAANLDRGTWRN